MLTFRVAFNQTLGRKLQSVLERGLTVDLRSLRNSFQLKLTLTIRLINVECFLYENDNFIITLLKHTPKGYNMSCVMPLEFYPNDSNGLVSSETRCDTRSNIVWVTQAPTLGP